MDEMFFCFLVIKKKEMQTYIYITPVYSNFAKKINYLVLTH